VEKMARDADAHVAEDRKKKEEIETRNQADAMVYNIEKMLREHRDKVSESDAKAVEQAVEETKKAMADGGTDRIRAAMDKLTSASHKLAEAMYRTAGQPGGGPTDGREQQPEEATADKGKDNVVDAEFVDVDEKEKGR